MTVGTLNMRGVGVDRASGAPDKWLCINQVMRENKIAVLALQETHITQERADGMNQLFANNIKIMVSPDQTNPSAAKGIAVVINKKIVDVSEVSYEVLVPGRAMVTKIPWTRGTKVTILAIYAPNDHAESTSFWGQLETKIGSLKIDLMLGDLNLVENALDRLPMRNDPLPQVEAFQRLCRRIKVHDIWRTWHPQERMFSFLQNATGSQSRIDRVYVGTEFKKNIIGWENVGPGFTTDHRLILCKMANKNKPYIGRGRWRMHAMLMADENYLKQVKEVGYKLQNKIKQNIRRTEENNVQIFYKEFKDEISALAKARAKESVPKLEKRIKGLRDGLKLLLNPREGGDNEEERERRKETAAMTQARIAELEIKRFGGRRMATAAKDWLEGETISKYWMRINKAMAEDETIYDLAIPSSNPKTYERRSEKMAEIARSHYDGVQADEGKPPIEEHRRLTREVLENVDAKLSDEQRNVMASVIGYNEVNEAVKMAASGKAPGMDGIPAELWKELAKRHETDTKKGKEGFDIVAVLRDIFNDIAEYGVQEGTDFTLGWIAPIYKLKGDKREIVNYRPITLLNTDYKLLTKTLAVKMAEVVGDLVHPDQAGFIPGRRIHHQTKLAQMTIDYCEAEEVNGVIIALDQEKAYDKIDHDYLWMVLKHMNFPARMINLIRRLYEKAESLVAVNGVLSRKFKIVRGTRQGDPMSCLLFDLAIEPLACALRKSSLRGLEIPGLGERLIAALYADDTTVYLHETDSYAVLEIILNKWCNAARAKFNKAKTEAIPLGMEDHRKKLLTDRKLTANGERLPQEVRIAPDGTAVRILGAWVGNKVDNEAPWIKILAVIQRNLNRWGSRNPTLVGRKLIVGLEVGSRTQYLARVQSRPGSVQDKIMSMVKDFIWKGNKHPRIGIETLQKPVEKGGLDLLDVEARNEAIELMWLKEYLQLNDDRPKWAFLADRLLAKAVTGAGRNTVPMARFNAFLQTWKVSTHPAAKLPEQLKKMVKAAAKYGVRVEVANPDEGLKLAMPSWYHIGSTVDRVVMNTPGLQCLRENHNVKTIADCMDIAARLRRQGSSYHMKAPRCTCFDCKRDKELTGCMNPNRCAEAAARMISKLSALWKPGRIEDDGLSLNTEGKKRNSEARRKGDEIVFNPSIRTGRAIAEALRVFVPKNAEPRIAPANRRPPPFTVEDEIISAYTDGAAFGNGSGGARAGAGVWCGDDNQYTMCERLPVGVPQSNQTAELYAISLIAQKAPQFAPLNIMSDSKYAVEGLTLWAEKWEAEGWIGVANKGAFQDAIARLRARNARTTIKWVKGHAGMVGNEKADQLAKRGAEMEQDEGRKLPDPPKKFLLRGAMMMRMTQKLAYRGIREIKEKGERKTTFEITDRVVDAVAAETGRVILKDSLWKSIRGKSIPRKIRDFLWMALHGAQKVGGFWKNVPNCNLRANCVVCGQEESMEHILTECNVEAATAVRALMLMMLEKKLGWTPEVTFGTILGASAVTFAEKLKKPTRGIDRLYMIVVHETAHLIWRMRCERTIEWGDKPELWHTKKEARNKWYAAINRRVKMDRALTYGRVGINRDLVRETWTGLMNERELGVPDWMTLGEVLVGRLGGNGGTEDG